MIFFQPRVVKSPPSQAASLAATQAFLANRASNGDLSAAAAAAALRSQTTSPAPVGQLQTKRMQRRGSVSSAGSAPERPGLLRRTSSGSMTERTFRDPSPSRPASSHGPYTRQEEPPPVPAIPKDIPSGRASVSAQQRAARRAASVEPPERVSSPPPRSVGGRGVSLDRGPGNLMPKDGAKNARIASLSAVGEIERPGSRSSVNFSRPMSPQNSPPASPLVGRRVKSPPPSKFTESTGLPSREESNTILENTTVPPKKKKKAVAKTPAEESNNAVDFNTRQAQSVPSQTPAQSSTLAPNTVIMPSGVNELPRPKKKRKKASAATKPQGQDAEDSFGNAYPSDTDSVTSERSSTNERPRTYNTRAAGLLMKRPSVVREDLEAEEQEESSLPPKKMNGQLAQTNTGGSATPANTSKVVAKGVQHGRSAVQTDAPQRNKRVSLDVPGSSRQQSLSPARSTHFLAQPEYETVDGIKHQPPARSVSPAKSALKHSPSRGSSPIGSLLASRAAGFAPSEASDTTSNMSDDASRSVPKKKKGVRVSFDDDSITVGRAASPPMSPDSPVIMSPQNKPKGRSWFDLVREKKQEQAKTSDKDQDGVIKPMPTLPSFGSIRRERGEEPVVDIVKQQNPSEDWAQDALRSMTSSSDHAVGSVIAQDAEAKAKTDPSKISQRQESTDPLPPEVTSVEGSGYHSDEENNLNNDEQEPMVSAQDKSLPSTIDSTSSNNDRSMEIPAPALQSGEHNPAVPSIALQPATPGLESADQEQKDWLRMPGNFRDSKEFSGDTPISISPNMEDQPSDITPATVGLAEPEPEAVVSQHDPATPHVGGMAEGLRTQLEAHSGDESEDSGDSIYSDAPDHPDPDDLGPDGFGSINAIVESQETSPIIPNAARSPPASPTVKPTTTKTTRPSPLTRDDSAMSQPASEEGWDKAQAYWSGLSQEKKRQLENAAMPGAIDERVIPNKTMRGPDSVKKKKKKVPKKSVPSPGAGNPSMPLGADKQYGSDTAKPVAPPLKSSLRNSQAVNTQEPHMRSSMRNGPPPKSTLRATQQRNSVQPLAPEPRSALQKKNRPTSAVAMVDYNKPQGVSAARNTRPSSVAVPSTSLTPIAAQPNKKAPAKKPMLRRNDSDSSSSFKKERPSTAASGKYTMKRTMRPSSLDTRGPTDRVGSLSARTASPTGSTTRRPFSTAGPGGGGMRTSLRDSSGSGKPPARTSLRGSMDSNRPKSPSRFGFGKSSKSKPAETKSNPRFSSRFGDSSDEEDSRPTRSSRFADSSDDEPAGLTPVRGIPRRIDEGDSTDLEDSSVEDAPATSQPKLNGVKPSLDTKPEGVALATGSLRVASGDTPATALGTGLQAKKAAEKDKKKRSFFGGLGSKKRNDPSRVMKADVESPARRDTPLERSKVERSLTITAPKDERVLGPSSPTADPVAQAGRPDMNSRTSSAQNSPKSPKLQRRNTPKRLTSANDISWPLPQNPDGAPGSRPRTSDGPAASNGTVRPEIGTRRTTVQGAPPPPNAPLVVGKTEKKKRFGMLRKALGIQN